IPEGKIKVGVPPLIGALFFPEIAGAFATEYPYVKLELVEHGAKKIETLIDEGEVEIGIVVSPTVKNKFNEFPFKKEDFKVFLHANHKLAHRKILTLEELKQENFILFNQEFALHNLIIRHCRNTDFQLNINSVRTQCDIVT